MLIPDHLRLMSPRRVTAWVMVMLLHIVGGVFASLPSSQNPSTPSVAAAHSGAIIQVSFVRPTPEEPVPEEPESAPVKPKAVPRSVVVSTKSDTPPARPPLRQAQDPRDLVDAPLSRPDVAPREIASYRVTDMPQYPIEAYDDGAEGWVVLIVLVGSDGMPEGVSVARSVSPEIDAAAIAAIAKWKFKPGEIRGSPVRSWISVPIGFFRGHLSDGRATASRTR